MKYSEATKLMKELNTPYIKITDTNGNRIWDCCDEIAAENTVNRLNAFLPTLKTWGACHFTCATEASKKQNWKDAYKWKVTFEDSNTQVQTDNAAERPKSGYITQTEAALMAQLEALKIQMQMQAQMNELTLKLNDQNKPDKWEKMIDKYAPIAGAFFNITPDKYENMMKIASIQGAINGGGGAPGMAGVNPVSKNNTSTEIKLTEEEKMQVDEFNNEIEKLSEKTDLPKLIALVKGLNKNPQYIEMATNFMNNLNK